MKKNSILKFFMFYNLLILIKSINIKTKEKGQSLNTINKSCKEIETCRHCTMEELKTIEECTITGYIKSTRCISENDEERQNTESCENITKINPVYIILIINIIIFYCAYKYQKTQKDSLIKNVMVKLSVFNQ